MVRELFERGCHPEEVVSGSVDEFEPTGTLAFVLVYLAILVVMWVFMYSFIGTVTYGALGPGVAMVDDAGGTIENANLEDTEFADPSVRQTGPE